MEAAAVAMGDAFGLIDDFFDFAGDDDDGGGGEGDASGDDLFLPMVPHLLDEDLRFLEAGPISCNSAAAGPLRRPKIELGEKVGIEQHSDWFSNILDEIADPFAFHAGDEATASGGAAADVDAAACGLKDDPNFRTRSPVSVLHPGRGGGWSWSSSSAATSSSSSCSGSGTTTTGYSCDARALETLGLAIPARPRTKRPRRASTSPSVSFVLPPEEPAIKEEEPAMKKEAEEMLRHDPPAPVGDECGSGAAAALGVRKCMHCEITKTPQWRAGPMGPRSLCNACGVRYKSGRLFPEYRPAASPTFVAAVHSNSHKKVVEIRNKRAPVAGRRPPASSAAKNCELMEYIRKH